MRWLPNEAKRGEGVQQEEEEEKDVNVLVVWNE